VLIHLGQVEGRKNHPANASEVHEPGDFPVVELDEAENVVAVVEGRIPSSARNWSTRRVSRSNGCTGSSGSCWPMATPRQQHECEVYCSPTSD